MRTNTKQNTTTKNKFKQYNIFQEILPFLCVGQSVIINWNICMNLPAKMRKYQVLFTAWQTQCLIQNFNNKNRSYPRYIYFLSLTITSKNLNRLYFPSLQLLYLVSFEQSAAHAVFPNFFAEVQGAGIYMVVDTRALGYRRCVPVLRHQFPGQTI